jgi:flavin reductase (DIM6/NTAB) family NADH-FMN oxidoreductase RutF
MKKSLGADTLAYPLPLYLLGTYAPNGQPNIMALAWTGIVSSVPPTIMVGVMPSRLTHEGIVKNQAFTVNFPNSALAAKADYAGLVSGRQHDKFAELGLTPVESALVKAPYVAECPVVAECRVMSRTEVGDHTMFVGEILDIKAEEGLSGADGGLDVLKVDPIVFNYMGDYHRVGPSLGKSFSCGLAYKEK